MTDHYACRCLNIKIHGKSTAGPSNTDFLPIDLDEEKVQVSLPQLTRRTHRSAENESDSTTYGEVTCLLCKMLVYRVRLEEGAGGSPKGLSILSITEWRDNNEASEPNYSTVEVSHNCLSGSKYDEAFKSQLISSAFSVLIEQKSQKDPPEPEASQIPDTFELEIPSLTSTLPPLFLAPPFTPAHPTFQTFSRPATKASEELRKAAEDDIKEYIRDRLARLQEAEASLRGDVNLLWKSWRDAANQERSQEERKGVLARQDSTPRSSRPPAEPRSSSSRSTPVRAASQASSPPGGKASMLSASLAQSSIHQHLRQSAESVAGSSSGPAGPPTETESITVVGEDDDIFSPFKRGTDETFAIAASHRIVMEDQEGFDARLAAAAARAAKEEEAERQERPELDRGRSSTNIRKVQFTEDTKEDTSEAETDAKDTSEPEVFDFDPPTEFEGPPETSVTPVASPRRSERRLPVGGPETLTEADSPAAPTPVERQYMDIIGADLPSHRSGWKSDRKVVLNDSSNIDGKHPAADDEDSISDTSEKSWNDISTAAKSLPVAIGTFGLPGGDIRQPKSSLADRPGIAVPPLVRRNSNSSSQRISASVATRNRVYAARDVSRSMDPGLSMPVNTIDEDEESHDGSSIPDGAPAEEGDVSATSEPQAERSRQRAAKILQKSRDAVPEVEMWRSMASE